jgi:hypothetical protein
MLLGPSLHEFNPEKVPLLQGSLALEDMIKIIPFSTNSRHSRPGQHRLDGGLAIGEIASSLPTPTVITFPRKITGMISI